MELYKKYRPKTLNEVVGNKETVSTLRIMLTKGTLPHTILFHGPTGTGKTSLSRIIRKELKCSQHDFVEINASSSRGIDTIREIEQTMRLAPMGGKYRIWLIDEAHQLAKLAQDAMLKILEDCPKQVRFIICTTDPGRLLPTLRNRCTELPVKTLTDKETEILLTRVSKAEGIKLGNGIIEDIIDHAEGSARKALVLLDKVQNLSPEDQAKALEEKQEEGKEAIDLARALINPQANWVQVAKVLHGLKGEDVESVRWTVLGYAQSVLLKGGKNSRAFNLLVAFENDFYSSKKAGLVKACYEVLHQGG